MATGVTPATAAAPRHDSRGRGRGGRAQLHGEVLRDLGYRVLEAPDGATALKMLGRTPSVVLLFTDVGLPGGMNGRQLAEEAGRLRSDLKVIFTTGYARNAIVHHGRLDPGVELLTKPFTQSSLAGKINRVLNEPAVES